MLPGGIGVELKPWQVGRGQLIVLHKLKSPAAKDALESTQISRVRLAFENTIGGHAVLGIVQCLPGVIKITAGSGELV